MGRRCVPRIGGRAARVLLCDDQPARCVDARARLRRAGEGRHHPERDLHPVRLRALPHRVRPMDAGQRGVAAGCLAARPAVHRQHDLRRHQPHRAGRHSRPLRAARHSIAACIGGPSRRSPPMRRSEWSPLGIVWATSHHLRSPCHHRLAGDQRSCRHRRRHLVGGAARVLEVLAAHRRARRRFSATAPAPSRTSSAAMRDGSDRRHGAAIRTTRSSPSRSSSARSACSSAGDVGGALADVHRRRDCRPGSGSWW